MLGRLSLRARLVLGVIVLAAAGLAAANVATYTSLRAFLFDRTDDALARSQPPLERSSHGGRCPGSDGRPPLGLAPGDFVQVRTGTDEIACTTQMTDLSGDVPSPPQLPDSIAA
jgi:two-component system, OmpR family, sensor kinase